MHLSLIQKVCYRIAYHVYCMDKITQEKMLLPFVKACQCVLLGLIQCASGHHLRRCGNHMVRNPTGNLHLWKPSSIFRQMFYLCMLIFTPKIYANDVITIITIHTEVFLRSTYRQCQFWIVTIIYLTYAIQDNFGVKWTFITVTDMLSIPQLVQLKESSWAFQYRQIILYHIL